MLVIGMFSGLTLIFSNLYVMLTDYSTYFFFWEYFLIAMIWATWRVLMTCGFGVWKCTKLISKRKNFNFFANSADTQYREVSGFGERKMENFIRTFFVIFAVAAVLAESALGEPSRSFVPLGCEGPSYTRCMFITKNRIERVQSKHIGRDLNLYYQSSLAFTGRIIAVDDYGHTRGTKITLEGIFWVNDQLTKTIVDQHLPLYMTPLGSVSGVSGVSGDAGISETKSGSGWGLLNRFGDPLFSVSGRMGTPTSPMSRTGVAFEYAKTPEFPVEVGIGTYNSPANELLNLPTKKINNLAVGGSLLLGLRGSQLSIGGHFVYSRAVLGKSLVDPSAASGGRNFFGIVPKLGLRFTSENSYLFTIDVGDYISLGPAMSDYLGQTPVSSAVLDGTSMTTYLEIGVGI